MSDVGGAKDHDQLGTALRAPPSFTASVLDRYPLSPLPKLPTIWHSSFTIVAVENCSEGGMGFGVHVVHDGIRHWGDATR